MRYRRCDLSGGNYFFTVNLAERSRGLLVEHIDPLRAAVRTVKHHWPRPNPPPRREEPWDPAGKSAVPAGGAAIQ